MLQDITYLHPYIYHIYICVVKGGGEERIYPMKHTYRKKREKGGGGSFVVYVHTYGVAIYLFGVQD